MSDQDKTEAEMDAEQQDEARAIQLLADQMLNGLIDILEDDKGLHAETTLAVAGQCCGNLLREAHFAEFPKGEPRPDPAAHPGIERDLESFCEIVIKGLEEQKVQVVASNTLGPEAEPLVPPQDAATQLRDRLDDDIPPPAHYMAGCVMLTRLISDTSAALDPAIGASIALKWFITGAVTEDEAGA